MIARIQQRLKENEDGFTLIELLVVMIIIGILAAIAIPVFLNQRNNAYESAVKSDLRGAAVEVESYFVNNQDYPASASTLTSVQTSAGVTLSYYDNGTSFCISGINSNGGGTFTYNSATGGLGTTACTGTAAGTWS